MTRLQVENQEIILVGTNHVDPESVKMTQQVILEERPDVVCIEWDQKRYEKNMFPNQWGETDIIKIIKEKKLITLIVTVIYKLIQKNLAKSPDIVVGGEFVQAVHSANEVNAKVALIDRDIPTTFSRFWRY
ncbi:MAG: TraB domain-containing protein [Enterococcus sp.]